MTQFGSKMPRSESFTQHKILQRIDRHSSTGMKYVIPILFGFR